jgi:hypothetical protein
MSDHLTDEQRRARDIALAKAIGDFAAALSSILDSKTPDQFFMTHAGDVKTGYVITVIASKGMAQATPLHDLVRQEARGFILACHAQEQENKSRCAKSDYPTQAGPAGRKNPSQN